MKMKDIKKLKIHRLSKLYLMYETDRFYFEDIYLNRIADLIIDSNLAENMFKEKILFEIAKRNLIYKYHLCFNLKNTFLK